MKKILLFIFVFFALPCMAGNHAREFLQIVLNNMQENYQHSIGIPLGQYSLYVDKEGKREAVYDTRTGQLVTDPVNRGSYNYFPYRLGIKHFLYDSYPWLNLGNSRDDTSTYQERLDAWLDDFVVSFEKVCRVKSSLLDASTVSFTEDKVFADLMEEIFVSFLSDERMEKLLSSKPCQMFDKFEKGNKADLLYLKKTLTDNFKDTPLSEAEVDELYAKMPRPKEFK
ncbi:MAG: hypothetical protein IKS41_06875 [Alphaproteobacteria bacterium]|nr:hypothetical protein [Alphaproteobacteria bacterium]